MVDKTSFNESNDSVLQNTLKPDYILELQRSDSHLKKNIIMHTNTSSKNSDGDFSTHTSIRITKSLPNKNAWDERSKSDKLNEISPNREDNLEKINDDSSFILLNGKQSTPYKTDEKSNQTHEKDSDSSPNMAFNRRSPNLERISKFFNTKKFSSRNLFSDLNAPHSTDSESSLDNDLSVSDAAIGRLKPKDINLKGNNNAFTMAIENHDETTEVNDLTEEDTTKITKTDTVDFNNNENTRAINLTRKETIKQEHVEKYHTDNATQIISPTTHLNLEVDSSNNKITDKISNFYHFSNSDNNNLDDHKTQIISSFPNGNFNSNNIENIGAITEPVTQIISNSQHLNLDLNYDNISSQGLASNINRNTQTQLITQSTQNGLQNVSQDDSQIIHLKKSNKVSTIYSFPDSQDETQLISNGNSMESQLTVDKEPTKNHTNLGIIVNSSASTNEKVSQPIENRLISSKSSSSECEKNSPIKASFSNMKDQHSKIITSSNTKQPLISQNLSMPLQNVDSKVNVVDTSLEVPATSSPTKISNSASFKEADINFNQEKNEFDNQIQIYSDSPVKEVVTLRISNDPVALTEDKEESDMDMTEGSIVLSDLEQDQDFKEIEGEVDVKEVDLLATQETINIVRSQEETRNAQQIDQDLNQNADSASNFEIINLDVEDSQSIIVNKRRKLRSQKDVGTTDDMHFQSPTKDIVIKDDDEALEDRKQNEEGESGLKEKEQNETESRNMQANNHHDVTSSDYPEGVRVSDEKFLSERDIVFENSVWYQYDLDLKYYPGLVDSFNDDDGTCIIIHNLGSTVCKMDDVYPLDLRVGDITTYQGNHYKVVGLECRTKSINAIRCIRGYDTAHLRKVGNTSLGRKILIVAIDSLTIDTESWSKRPKLVESTPTEVTERDAFKFLKRPIRGRKAANTPSPRKKIKRELSELNNLFDTSTAQDSSSRKVSGHRHSTISIYSLEDAKAKTSFDNKIFRSCLFVLTMLSEFEEDLRRLIEAYGGRVLSISLSEMFRIQETKVEFDNMKTYNLNLQLKEKYRNRKYNFVGLLTKSHTRSSKYIEMLALGWPTLHWKFVEACIDNHKLKSNLIFSYLLPSGESTFLSLGDNSAKGIIKSNNIFDFYTNYTNGLGIDKQIKAKKHLMKDFYVIICGKSGLDHFFRFIFSCLGVTKLYQINSTHFNTDSTQNQLNQIFSDCQQEKTKLLIFLDAPNKNISDSLRVLRKTVMESSQNDVRYHIESKEWLIQTIINENTNFI